MVNFKVKLENDIVEKWRNHYIDYKTLENSISQNNRKHERKSPRGLGTFSFQKPLLEAPSFAETYDAEIEKVEIFYCTKMAELKTRYEQQMEQNAKEEKITDIDLEDEEKAASSSLISTESLKRSMLKFYRQLKYLQSFCILNYTGFVKILKKHNKAMERNKTTRMDTSSSKREIDSKKDRATAVPSIINVAEDDAAASEIIIGSPSVSSSHHLSPPNESYENNWICKVKEAEMLYARKFCGDDIVQAQAELLSKQATTSFDWRLFQLGYRFGACLILTFWLLWDSIVDTLYRPPQNSNWLHRRTVRPFPFLANAMKYVVSMAVSLFSTLHAASEVRKDPAPYTAFYILFTCIATIYSYVVSMAVSLFSTLHAASEVRKDPAPYTAFYILFTCIATIYSYVWDITMDWGLARKCDQPNHPIYDDENLLEEFEGRSALEDSSVAGAFFLSHHRIARNWLMFGNRWIYYTVILVDLIGRFMWVITLMPRNDNPIPLFPDLVTPFLAAIELCRRAMFRRFEGPVPDHFDSAMQTKPEPERKTLWQVAKEMSLMVGLGGALIGISIYFGISKD
eukprot:jgi/Bigna1/66272/fgenesh1_pg.1_\